MDLNMLEWLKHVLERAEMDCWEPVSQRHGDNLWRCRSCEQEHPRRLTAWGDGVGDFKHVDGCTEHREQLALRAYMTAETAECEARGEQYECWRDP